MQQQQEEKQQHHYLQHHQATERLLRGLQIADFAVNDHRSCAERKLIDTCVMEARKRGVRPHKVAAYVRRRLGGGVSILRFRSDGSPGCAAPCTLCTKELLKFDLKVNCLLESGEVFCGRLTDPGAPRAKVTTGQRNLLAHWACCKDAKAATTAGKGGGSGRSSSSALGAGRSNGGSEARLAGSSVAAAANAAGPRAGSGASGRGRAGSSSSSSSKSSGSSSSDGEGRNAKPGSSSRTAARGSGGRPGRGGR